MWNKDSKNKVVAMETAAPTAVGCPSARVRQMEKKAEAAPASQAAPIVESQLTTWPVQIKLLPPSAPYFDGADLLIAADCTAYAYGDFHNKFLKDKVLLVGCPKLDAVDYSEKLTQIFTNNDIHSITLTRMVVPCCGGLQFAVERAIEASGKDIPLNVVTISLDGKILED